LAIAIRSDFIVLKWRFIILIFHQTHKEKFKKESM